MFLTVQHVPQDTPLQTPGAASQVDFGHVASGSSMVVAWCWWCIPLCYGIMSFVLMLREGAKDKENGPWHQLVTLPGPFSLVVSTFTV